MKEFLVQSEADLVALVAPLLEFANGERVFLFEGDLGAGKTTFIKNIAKHLGVEGGMSSPSFSFVNEYETHTGEMLYHFDCYRLKSIDEALDIGIEEYLQAGNFCFVEWPEKIAPLLEGTEIKISITLQNKQRLIRFTRQDGII